MAELGRWNDDRLDEMARKLSRMDEVVTDVAIVKTELRNLTRELRANTAATEHVGGQLEQAKLEPVERHKRIRDAIIIALVSGTFGAVLAVVSALIASGH